MNRRTMGGASAFCLVAAMTPWAGAGEPEAWPERVVRIEQMSLRTLPEVKVPIPREIDRKRSSTVVLHVCVDDAGRSRDVRLAESSGNPAIDETALRAVRKATFEPFRADGRPSAVTLVMPMHFPFAERR